MTQEIDLLDTAIEYSPAEASPERSHDGLPPDFRLDDEGVYLRGSPSARDDGWSWICSPLRVIALTHDRHGTGWGRLIKVSDPDGHEHRWAMPARLLASDGAELRAALLDLGLRVNEGPKARSALSRLLQQWTPSARAITTDRLGWADPTFSTFVLGDGRVVGADNVVFQHETTVSCAAEMRASGTLDAWRERVAQPCIGNPLLVLAVSTAFAGPLLEPLGLDGGGFHLRGASSRGKSTAQRAAVSVWGSPRFMTTWRATSNGLEGVASACNATLLTLDEMAEVDGREAAKAAYMLANGNGKTRSDRRGRARAPARWKVMILSSGEISLADKVEEAGGKATAGQLVRLLDIPADGFAHGAFDDLHGAADGAEFVDLLKIATAEEFGTAGPAFVEALVAGLVEVVDEVRTAMRSFEDLAAEHHRIDHGEGQIARAVERFGLAAAAGELATRLGLTGWQSGLARDAALEHLGLWINSRGGNGPSELGEATRRVRAFIVQHGDTRFEPLQLWEDHRPVPNRAGWRDRGVYLIAPDVWKEIHKGADAKRAARYLRDAGLLLPADGDNLAQRLPRRRDGSRPRAYAISAEILGTDHD